ncbi:MAG: molecular chaperone DnaJ [Armatimonadetes bacterium]|nr:MAG: molecular chaperone DnaJ [Armatimonadota bacterium]MCE7900122.1 molecular chaperone DnaJ [Armatimonadetes bacterium ATM1]MDL1929423.1 molecular chaperone DnaJ [Fimbriimonadia bacterium ATM]MBC6968993.1 molecular chaperone DnaJ [Armatimonadota bacterium]MBL1148941.1 molecular chaperone DnaJ [Armatimonadota bacterium]
MPEQDYYALLGVPRDADADQIKAAFRRKARKLHPDVNRDDPDAEEKFKRIGEAYAVLSDPKKRAEYDRFGRVSDGGPAADFTGGIADIFEMFFGVGSARRSGPRIVDGRDLKAQVAVTLQEVVTGTHKKLSFRRMETCSECNGSGTIPGYQPETCEDCGGAGVVMEVTQTLLGHIRRTATCRRCGGEGRVNRKPCKACKGKMLEEKDVDVDVAIPSGVESGTILHLPYQGDDGVNGGRPGDLYVVVNVQEDARFIRDSKGLLTQVEITYPQAALGATVRLQGVDGEFDLVIPPGSQPGQEISVREQGIPAMGSTKRGDLRVRLVVRVPRELTDYQRHLLEQLQKSFTGQNTDSKTGGFFEQFRKSVRTEK